MHWMLKNNNINFGAFMVFMPLNCQNSFHRHETLFMVLRYNVHVSIIFSKKINHDDFNGHQYRRLNMHDIMCLFLDQFVITYFSVDF